MRERIFRVIVGARGRDIQVLSGGENLLGGWAAKLVLAADEKNFFINSFIRQCRIGCEYKIRSRRGYLKN